MTASRVGQFAVIGLAFLAFPAAQARAEMILTTNSQVIFLQDNGTQGTTFTLTGGPTGVAINQTGVGLQTLPGGGNGNQGDFYVATSSNQLFLFSKDGSQTLASTTTSLNNPQGLTLDAAGNVYVANLGAGNILKFNPTLTTVLQTYPATSIPNTRYESIAFGPDGNLYAAAIFQAGPTPNGEILRFNPSTGAATTVVANTGTQTVGGITFDQAGNILVVAQNPGSSVVQQYTTAGTLLGNFVTNTGLTPNTLSGSTLGIGFGLDGNFYVADQGNNRVLQYPPTGGSSATNFFSVTSPQFFAFASPEPGSLTLVALGAAAGALGYWRRRKPAAPDADAPAAPEETPAV